MMVVKIAANSFATSLIGSQAEPVRFAMLVRGQPQ